MLSRLIVQWISFLKIRRRATILLKDTIDLYEVSESIVPFSFGSSIFINRQLHNDEELEDILRHEYVHVRQKHTIDIIWAEILCLLNWYNPFAWLLRYHIRQNLEFVADSKVLENGVDKKQYQYLLLKVMGISNIQIATPFNFSSLKKRIIMMNKIKSAKVHLVKFLFVLPMLAVLLIAFRSKIIEANSGDQSNLITISGIVVQGDNYEPLSNVHYSVAGSKIEGNTDKKGYYTYSLPITGYPQKVSTLFSKYGYKSNQANREFSDITRNSNSIHVEIIGLTTGNAESSSTYSFVHSTLLTGITNNKERYAGVLKKFEEIKIGNDEKIALKELSNGSEKPYWMINGHSYILNAGEGPVSWDTIATTVIVDGKKMTGEEVNLRIKRSSISDLSAKRSDVDGYFFEINTKSVATKTRTDDN